MEMEIQQEMKAVPSIKAIDGRSVHQICSGQVVLNLTAAVKELLENSVDAGASNIEIKLRDYGMENIDVQDNGSGIEEQDYEAVALKHCTSKLRDFADLTTIDSFGFRGEALSSLCALSKLSITTRHETKDVGCKLDFDNDGKLVKKTPCAREKGTTVSVSQLFYSLPVRHKEFQRNIKKEFAKLSLILQAYGIISSGIRFNCINYSDKNKKTVILSTPGSRKILENMASIFGAKQIQNLLPFTQQLPDPEVLDHFNIAPKIASENENIFDISGYITRIDHGCGRSTPDRQFYFVNKRPCDLPKVSRLVNEVYHMFNRNQYPFVVLDISMKADQVDVNVTPDKRQLFIQHEKLLLATIKASLLHMFNGTAGQYEYNNRDATAARMPVAKVESTCINDAGDTSVLQQPYAAPPISVTSSVAQGRSLITSVLGNFRSRFAKNKIAEQKNVAGKVQTGMDKFTFKLLKASGDQEQDDSVAGNLPLAEKEDVLLQHGKLETVEAKARDGDGPSANNQGTNRNDGHSLTKHTTVVEREAREESPVIDVDSDYGINHAVTDQVSSCNIVKERCITEEGPASKKRFKEKHNVVSGCFQGSWQAQSISHSPEKMKLQVSEGLEDNRFQEQDHASIDEDRNCEMRAPQATVSKPLDQSPDLTLGLENGGGETSKQNLDDSPSSNQNSQTKSQKVQSQNDVKYRPSVVIPFDMHKLREHIRTREMPSQKDSHDDNGIRGFRAKIEPAQNKDAEDELGRNISKDMFNNMKILGQFNLGFIIARLDEDLFIIDQHATDEKYNFEKLQREHCLKGQRLIRPRPLELTAVSESVLIDNLEIFNKNGFDFIIDESKAPTERVKLVSLPTSKNWTFDVGDIEELIFMLSDTPGTVCRPSRVRNMFASRACRMSTMIGSPLSQSQMTKLVCHMGEIEQPWNCPHGRPTMRHLINLRRIQTNNATT